MKTEAMAQDSNDQGDVSLGSLELSTELERLSRLLNDLQCKMRDDRRLKRAADEATAKAALACALTTKRGPTQAGPASYASSSDARVIA